MKLMKQIPWLAMSAPVFAMTVTSSGDGTSRSPNVLFIITDDLNDSVEGLGGHPQAKTPNMDRLIKRGVRFTNAHANYAICTASRASLMSGLYPSTTGAFGFDQSANYRANPSLKGSVTLIEHLARNGYEVFGTGKIFHGSLGEWNRENVTYGVHEDFGPWPFDGVHPEPGKYYRRLPHPGLPKELNWDAAFGPLSNIPEYLPDPDKNIPGYKGWFSGGKPFRYENDEDRDPMNDERHAAWARDILQKKHEKPFFLGVGFVRPHSPLYAPEKYFEMFPLEDVELPPYKDTDLEDCAKILWNPITQGRGGWSTTYGHEKFLMYKNLGLWKEWIQAYLANVAYLDDQIGVVLNALEQSPYKDNTIIILTSDHGFHMGEKDWIFKHTLWEEATKVPFIVVDPRNGVHNRECSKPVSLIDLYPTIIDLCGLPKEPNQNGNKIPLDGFSIKPLMDDPEKGTWAGPPVALNAIAPNETHLSKSLEGEVDKQHYAVRSERWRYILCNNGEEELYDHENDPQEWTNLAKNTEYAGEKEKLKQQLQKLLAGKPKLQIPVDLQKKGIYEAEAGEVFGSAQASNGFVIGMRSGGCAITVDGGAGGEFELSIAYATKLENVRAELIVNGTSQTIAFPSTGSWNETKMVTQIVRLSPGQANRIELKGRGQGVNLDYVKISRR